MAPLMANFLLIRLKVTQSKAATSMDSLALLRVFGSPEAVVGITVTLVLFIKFWLLGSEKKVLDSPVLGHPRQTAFGDALVAGYQRASLWIT